MDFFALWPELAGKSENPYYVEDCGNTQEEHCLLHLIITTLPHNNGFLNCPQTSAKSSNMHCPFLIL
jgi:hypothetical protein